MSNTELNKEILDILDNVIHWETCPKDYKVRIKAIKEQLTLTDVSKCYTEKDMDNAYDKGFKDGNQRDLTGSLIEVL